MFIKKLFAIITTVTTILNFSIIYSFAEEELMTSYEFFQQSQQFISEYSSGIIAGGDVSELPTNRLIVKTNSDEPLEDDFGAIETLNGFGGFHILQYETESETNVAFVSLSQSNVEYVEYDYWLTAATTSTKCCCSENLSDDTSCNCPEKEYTQTTSCMCPDNTSTNHLSWNSSIVQVDEAFNYIENKAINCEPIYVAVFDTGFYGKHTHFDYNRIHYDGKYSLGNILSNNNKTYPSNEDLYNHGTHVIGTIYDNTMDNVKIVPYRVFSETLNSLPYVVFCAAMQAAIEADFDEDGYPDIDVINMSLRKPPYEDTSENKMLEDIMNQAIEKNIVIVAVAGNEKNDAYTYIPSKFENIITVAASEKDNTAAKGYSSYGDCVDIAAPGTNIYSTVPVVFPVNTTENPQSLYVRLTGTSMAAPLVAAAAATLKSVRPDLSASEIQRIIKETAYVPEGWDTNYGVGIVNFLNMVKAATTEVKPTITAKDGKIEMTAPAGSDSRIYYTLDGSIPTIDNHIVYTEPFSLSGVSAEMITAVCHENGKLIGEPVTTINHSASVYYKHSKALVPISSGAKMKWSSSNPNIASVDCKGNITGVSPGTTYVYATRADGIKMVYKVTVDYSLWQEILIKLFFGFLWYI